MELLRPAVLWVLCQSGSPLVGGMVALRAPRQPARGFPWVGGHTHTAEETAPGRANPAWLAKTKCMIPVGGEVPTVLPAAALDVMDEEQAVAAVMEWCWICWLSKAGKL